jgi:hypothetical protein
MLLFFQNLILLSNFLIYGLIDIFNFLKLNLILRKIRVDFALGVIEWMTFEISFYLHRVSVSYPQGKIDVILAFSNVIQQCLENLIMITNPFN